MGRWFGYRETYADLPRIWMTQELRDWFYALATVEAEIRRDIRRYEDEGLTPREFAVRIRTHPQMAVTAAAKMRDAVTVNVSYSGSRQQTILFNHTDAEWLEGNLRVTRDFLSALRSRGLGPTTPQSPREYGGRRLFLGASSTDVMDFLARYQFHERAFQLRSRLLNGYIRDQNAVGKLLRWNVAVIGHADVANGSIDLGTGEAVGVIQRSRMNMPDLGYANVKAIMSTVDRIVDCPQLTPEDIRGADDAKLAELRQDLIGDVGLLCIYPISKDSQPLKRAVPQVRNPRRQRIPLDAVEHVVGLGLIFPESSRDQLTPQSYVAADLARLAGAEGVELEDVDVDDVDRADEEAGSQEPGGGRS